MTVKATSVLSVLAIWATMIPAVIVEPGAWWALIFAFLSTGAIGLSAWRRLGLSRLIAIAGTWLGTAIAIGDNSDNAWLAIFAFLTTGAVVYSIMRRDAYLHGLGMAVAWIMTGAIIVNSDGGGAWVGVLAFLTAAATTNSRHGTSHGLITAGAWLVAGVISLAAGGLYWLAVIAFIVSVTHLPFTGGGFSIPRRIEWDLFDRDDDSERVRVVR